MSDKEKKATLLVIGCTIVGIGINFSTMLVGIGIGLVIVSILWYLD